MLPFVLFCSLCIPVLIVLIIVRYNIFRTVLKIFTNYMGKQPSDADSKEESKESVVEIESAKSKTLMEEEPYAAVIDTIALPLTCSKCLDWNITRRRRIALHRCGGCKFIFYCSKKCQKADWADHKAECSYFRSPIPCLPRSKVRLVARMLRKSRAHPEWKAFNGRTYDSLMDHCEHHRKDEKFMETVNAEFAEIKMFMKEDAPDFETFFIARSKVETNAFGLMVYSWREQCRGIGLYLGLSVHNHSCRPDAYVVQQGSTLLLRTTKMNCVYSDKITISYSPRGHVAEGDLRREIFWNRYFFVCRCDECEDFESEKKRVSGRPRCCIAGWFSLDDLRCSICNKEISTDLRDKAVAANKSLKDALLNRYYDSIADPMQSMIKDFFMYARSLSDENAYLRCFADMIRIWADDIGDKMIFSYFCQSYLRSDPYSIVLALLHLETYLDLERAEKYEKAREELEQAHEKIETVFGKDHYLTKGLENQKLQYNRIAARIAASRE